MKRKKLKIIPVKQDGHLCKSVTLATIDRFYAASLGFLEIPVHKRNNPMDAYPRHVKSMRELAKNQGSVQGELLSINQVMVISKQIGYDAVLVEFKDNFDLFKTTIIEAIEKGDLIFAAFAVDVESGYPSACLLLDEGTNEHAAVIHGYDEEQGTIYITHWEQEWVCPFKDFYESSMALLDTRTPEYYINIKDKLSKKGYKYDYSKDQTDAALTNQNIKAIKSIEPTLDSGFRAKLIVFKKPNLDQIKSARIGVQSVIPERQPGYFSLDYFSNRLDYASKFLTGITFPPIATGSVRNAKVSEINFIAHLFLDGETGGTPLDGGDTLFIVKAFNQFLTSLESRRKLHPHFDALIRKLALAPTDKQSNFFKVLEQQVQGLIECEEKQRSIIKDFHGKEKSDANQNLIDSLLSRVATNIVDRLDKLGDVFFCGGFGGRPGHALIYRLNKQKKGIYFCVYDSSNTDFHETVFLSSGRPGHYPLYAICIPHATTNEKICQFLVSLMKFQVLPHIDPTHYRYSEGDLYQTLFTASTWFDGYVLSPEKLSHPTTPQRSGTCVWKAFQLFLRAMIPDDQSYRHFLLSFRLYYFSHVFEKLNDSQKQMQGLNKLFKRSLANLARMVDTTIKKNVELSSADRDLICFNIKLWREAIGSIDLRLNDRVIYARRETQAGSSFRINQRFRDTLMINVSPQSEIQQSKEKYTLSVHFDQDVSSLIDYLNIPHLNEFAYTNAIALFCIYYTNLQNSFELVGYSNQLERQSVLIDQLSAVLKNYIVRQPALNTQSVVIYLSLISIVVRLTKEGHFQFCDQKLFCKWAYSPLKRLVSRLSRNAFLATFEPTLDELWSQLQIFYSENIVADSPLEHYVNLIKKANQTENEALQQHWEIISGESLESVELLAAINSLFYPLGGTSYCYAFLSQAERVKTNQKTPELNKVFAMQMAIESFMMLGLQEIVYARKEKDSALTRLSQNLTIDFSARNIWDSIKGEEGVELTLKNILSIDGADLFLNRDLLPANLNRAQVANEALLNHFDGNGPISEEIPYLSDVFSSTAPVLVEDRLNKSYSLIESIPPKEQQFSALLKHLNTMPEYQTITLLTELLNHPGWLLDETLHDYILLSIFQPNSLLSALKNDADIWPAINQLSNKAGGHHTSEQFFVYKLIALISGYALDALTNGLIALKTQDFNIIAQCFEKVLAVVEYHLRFEPQEAPSELNHDWHYWRLYVLIKQHKVLPPEWRDRFLESYWVCSLFSFEKNTHLNGRDIQILDKAYLLIASDSEVEEKSLALIKRFNMVPKAEVVVIDVLRRTIKIDDEHLVSLPRAIRDSVEYRECLQQHFTYATKSEVVIGRHKFESYFWIYEGYAYRAFFDPDSHQLFLQKRIASTWYTYTIPSKKMQSAHGFHQYAFVDCLPLLEQIHYRVWVANQNDWQIIDYKTGQVQYTYSHGILYAGLPTSGVRCEMLQSEADLPVCLHAFEDVKFTLLLSPTKKKSWHFLRYGLTFTETARDVYQTLDNQYRVNKAPTELVNLFGTGISLTKISSGQPFLMMPVQSYYIPKISVRYHRTKDETHYLWMHDLSNHLPATYIAERDADKTVGWDFSQHEKFILYKIGQDNMPIPTTSTESLYLAYLYSAQDRPKRALECLNTMILQGTVQELVFLWWIIEKQPEGNDKKIINPRMCAVQLKALMLMYELKVQLGDRLNVTDKSSTPHPISSNARYKMNQQVMLTRFMSGLREQIKCCYVQYNNIRNNIPIGMRLSEIDERRILSASVNQASPQDNQSELVLKMRYLEKFSDEPQVIRYQNFFLTHIEKRLKVGASLWINYLLIIDTEHRDIFDIVQPHKIKPGILNEIHPFMDAERLLKCFPGLYELARTTQDPEEIKRLKHFCSACIASHYHRDDKQVKLKIVFVLISEITWIVLHFQSLFPPCFNKPRYPGQTVLDIAKIATPLKEVPDIIYDCPARLPKWNKFQSMGKLKPDTSGSENMFFIPKKMKGVFWREIDDRKSQLHQALTEKKREIMAQVPFLENESFEIQSQQKAQLEKTFFEWEQIEQEKAMICLDGVASKDFKSHLTKEIIDIKDLLSHHAQTIISIIKRPLLQGETARLGKLQRKLTLKNLTNHSAELQSSDFKNIGFSPEDSAQLIESLRLQLDLQSQLMRLKHIEAKYKMFQSEKTPFSRAALLKALFSEPDVLYSHEMIFEYINQLILRPEQIDFLKAIFKAETATSTLPSKVMQMMMGGGKTKVILPLWAYQKADGTHLPVIIVPAMSLAVNYADLAAISLRSFNQKPVCFHFDRNSADDPESLRITYEQLDIARTGRSYIVSTLTTWQSIELKYLEILNSKPNENAEFRTLQLHWLTKILTLLREKASAAIDEAHSLLHVKKALVYELLEFNNPVSCLMDDVLIEICCDFFSWLSAQPEEIFAHNKSTDKMLSEDEITALIAENLRRFCNATENDDSPVWIKELIFSPLRKSDLFRFLSGETVDTPDILDKHVQLKKQWLFLALLFQNYLPLTLSKKIFQHYGPSDNPDTLYAIPYRANNVPTEFVFGDYILTSVYTAMMIFYRGLEQKEFKSIVSHWQHQALAGRNENAGKMSAAEQQFSLIFSSPDVPSLLECDLNHPATLSDLYQRGKHKADLIVPALKQRLKQIPLQENTLCSHGMNLVNQFNHVVCLTGTPGHKNTLHQDMATTYDPSMGVEGKIQQYLLDKNMNVEKVIPSELQLKLTSLIKDNQNIRAIIDYGSFFRGVENKDVAILLAQICLASSKKMKYILFFEKDQLLALEMGTRLITRLSSSEISHIEVSLSCTKEEIFTYFDEEHALGVDIGQTDSAQAVLTVDVIQGVLSQFLQAAMRMRGLGEKQSLVIFSTHDETLASLFKRLLRNEDANTKEESFKAALNKIHNLFRNQQLRRLLSEPDAIKRDALFAQVSLLFIEKTENSMASLYALKRASCSPRQVLQQYYQTLLKQWPDVLQAEDIRMVEDIIDATASMFTDMPLKQDLAYSKEITLERQRFVEKQQELSKQGQTKLVRLKRTDLSWVDEIFSGKPLFNKVLSDQFQDLTWKFSDHLYVSPNCLYVSQKTYHNLFYTPYSKPILVVGFLINASLVEGIMMTLDDAKILERKFKNNELCLMSINGMAFNVQSSSMYQAHKVAIDSLLQQAQFASGRIGCLMGKPLSQWFEDRTQEKMRFLKTITTYFSLDQSFLPQFEQQLMQTRTYLQVWVGLPISAETYIEQLTKKNIARATLRRLQQLIPQLQQLREHILCHGSAETFAEKLDGLDLDDKVFFKSYKITLEWFMHCKAGDKLENAVRFYLQHQAFIDTNGFAYFIPNQAISSEAMDFAVKITKTLAIDSVKHLLNIFKFNQDDLTVGLESLVINYERYRLALEVLYKTDTKDTKKAALALVHDDALKSNPSLYAYLLQKNLSIKTWSWIFNYHEARLDLLGHSSHDPMVILLMIAFRYHELPAPAALLMTHPYEKAVGFHQFELIFNESVEDLMRWAIDFCAELAKSKAEIADEAYQGFIQQIVDYYVCGTLSEDAFFSYLLTTFVYPKGANLIEKMLNTEAKNTYRRHKLKAFETAHRVNVLSLSGDSTPFETGFEENQFMLQQIAKFEIIRNQLNQMGCSELEMAFIMQFLNEDLTATKIDRIYQRMHSGDFEAAIRELTPLGKNAFSFVLARFAYDSFEEQLYLDLSTKYSKIIEENNALFCHLVASVSLTTLKIILERFDFFRPGLFPFFAKGYVSSGPIMLFVRLSEHITSNEFLEELASLLVDIRPEDVDWWSYLLKILNPIGTVQRVCMDFSSEVMSRRFIAQIRILKSFPNQVLRNIYANEQYLKQNDLEDSLRVALDYFLVYDHSDKEMFEEACPHFDLLIKHNISDGYFYQRFYYAFEKHLYACFKYKQLLGVLKASETSEFFRTYKSCERKFIGKLKLMNETERGVPGLMFDEMSPQIKKTIESWLSDNAVSLQCLYHTSIKTAEVLVEKIIALNQKKIVTSYLSDLGYIPLLAHTALEGYLSEDRKKSSEALSRLTKFICQSPDAHKKIIAQIASSDKDKNSYSLGLVREGILKRMVLLSDDMDESEDHKPSLS